MSCIIHTQKYIITLFIKMKKKYLPSKQFIFRIIIIVVLIAGVFSIYKIINFY